MKSNKLFDLIIEDLGYENAYTFKDSILYTDNKNFILPKLIHNLEKPLRIIPPNNPSKYNFKFHKHYYEADNGFVTYLNEDVKKLCTHSIIDFSSKRVFTNHIADGVSMPDMRVCDIFNEYRILSHERTTDKVKDYVGECCVERSRDNSIIVYIKEMKWFIRFCQQTIEAFDKVDALDSFSDFIYEHIYDREKLFFTHLFIEQLRSIFTDVANRDFYTDWYHQHRIKCLSICLTENKDATDKLINDCKSLSDAFPHKRLRTMPFYCDNIEDLTFAKMILGDIYVEIHTTKMNHNHIIEYWGM